MSVLFLTPFHDEAPGIARKAEELAALGPALLVSDGSADDGPALARRAGAEVLELPRMGKTAALRAALARYPGPPDEIVILSDANVEVSGALRDALVSALAPVDVGAAAAPVLPADGGPERWYWKMENAIRSAEGRAGAVIGCSGACWAARRAHLEAIDFEGMYCEDLWIPLAILARGRKVVFADGPPAVERGAGRSERVEIRRRMRIMRGNLQIVARLGEIWTDLPPRARAYFLAHKAARWAAAPAGLLAAAALSLAAARRGPRSGAAVAAGWGALLAFRPMRYFFGMNFALAAGLVRAIVSRDQGRGIWTPERHG